MNKTLEASVFVAGIIITSITFKVLGASGLKLSPDIDTHSMFSANDTSGMNY